MVDFIYHLVVYWMVHQVVHQVVVKLSFQQEVVVSTGGWSTGCYRGWLTRRFMS